MKYRSYYLEYDPQQAPWDQQHYRMYTFWGNLVRPIATDQPTSLLWATHYNSQSHHFEFRVNTEQPDATDDRVRELCDKWRLKYDDEKIQSDLPGNLGHSRFLAAERNDKNDYDRALLVLKYLDAISRLVVDQVVPVDDKYWRLEKNDHSENPLGNGFESLAHLLANMTGFEFDVFLTSQTAWMGRGQLFAQIRHHL